MQSHEKMHQGKQTKIVTNFVQDTVPLLSLVVVEERVDDILKLTIHRLKLLMHLTIHGLYQ